MTASPGIYGLCLVKNEDDIVAQSLTYAAGHCERIFVLDNGSTDRTWEIVHELAARNPVIVPFEQTREPFDNGMRARVYNAVHHTLSDRDWWHIIDADEFLAEDPRPSIESAMRTGADLVKTWQIQFYFTEQDVRDWESGRDRRDQPIAERRRYYVINWQEPRLFRNDPRRTWNARSAYNATPDWLAHTARRRILNRHYQFRDPEQIEKRQQLRWGHSQFPHVRGLDWRSEVRPSRTLNRHADGAAWHFSAAGLCYFYRRNLYLRARSAYHGGARRRLQRLLSST